MSRLNVAPCRTGQEPPDGAPCYAVLCCQDRLCGADGSELSYFQGIGLRQLRAGMAAPQQATSSASPFGVTVSRIVSMGPQEKVDWSHAGVNIAAVQDEEPVRDRPVGYFPSQTMGLEDSSPRYADRAIAIPKATTEPQPACPQVRHMRRDGSVFVDTRPQALLGRAATTGDMSIIGLHRDLPLVRNRGAAPRAATNSIGAFSCPDFTMPDQIEARGARW